MRADLGGRWRSGEKVGREIANELLENMRQAKESERSGRRKGESTALR